MGVLEANAFAVYLLLGTVAWASLGGACWCVVWKTYPADDLAARSGTSGLSEDHMFWSGFALMATIWPFAVLLLVFALIKDVIDHIRGQGKNDGDNE